MISGIARAFFIFSEKIFAEPGEGKMCAGQRGEDVL
jgi:hypothetical protein